MNDNVIGIIGGMGSYATVDFFKRCIDAFPVEKEWDRPRILIDNYCTMPSRVRAILYNERKEELIEDLSESMKNMVKCGVKQIVLACNTSHVFLPEVFKKVPEAKDKVIHIIDECARFCSTMGEGQTYLLASEGTILCGIYDEFFAKYNCDLLHPGEETFGSLREFIEAVKQNYIDKEVSKKFIDFLNKLPGETIILGCTELPILYAESISRGLKTSKHIVDPLECAIVKIQHYECAELK